MTQNEPRNHHYVPQHFLTGWKTASGKVWRYRRIAATGHLEVREVAIRKTASEDDLYRISFEDGSFEIESRIVTPMIDEDGHKILEAARSESIVTWGAEKRRNLAYYLTCLEARHPDILEAMDIRSRLEEVRKNMKAEGMAASEESVDEVVDYFKKPDSLGALAFGYFVQNESKPLLAKPFAEGLMGANLREYAFQTASLLSSNYPMARWGDYGKDVFCVVALSPRKAAIYSSNDDVDVFGIIPEHVRSRLVNLYTLAKADTVYFYDRSLKEFVNEHLGWAKTVTNLEDQKKYVEKFVERELRA